VTDFLPVDPAGAVPVDAAGIPVRVSTSPAPAAPHVHLGGGHWAVRVPSVAGLGTGVRPARAFAGDRDISRAVALLRHRDRHLFDPADGSTLAYDDDGIRAAGASGRELYPRVDPAVIGLIRRADAEAILLGRGVDRPYFSLIAGYVDPGETLEEAVAREAFEETGRRITEVTYWGSQPWAVSGSIMVGFTAVTSDIDAVAGTDGELAEIRWATRDDLTHLPLAGEGSIAHAMITAWRNA